MNFIPQFIRPFEDELLYSWFIRLSQANGLTPTSFLNLYSGNNEKPLKHWTYDVKTFFSKLCQSIRNPINIQDIFLQHSTFNFDGILLTESHQTRYINDVFREKNPLNRALPSAITEIKYCPECHKEEITPYLHVSHNLSGVSMCTKHHCRLKVFRGTWGHEMEFNEENYQDIDCENEEAALAYAEYVQCLNQNTINFNIHDIKQVLFAKLKENNYVADNGYKTLIDDIAQWDYRNLISVNIEKFLKSKMTYATYIYPIELIPFFMFLWPNPKDFLNCFEGKPCVIKTYCCSDCGCTYVATTSSQSDGWGCPQCEISIHDLFDRIITTKTKGQYEVRCQFEATDKKIELYHKNCEESFFVKPRDFIFEDVRCPCESRTTFKQAQKVIEKDGNFKLIKFKSAYETATIQHIPCGTTLHKSYDRFTNNPNCPVCNPQPGDILTKDSFISQMKALTGDEYELVSDFTDTHVMIKHNICQEAQSYRPRDFLNGIRCKQCSKHMSLNELNSLLKQYSDGRYYITEKKHNYCFVYDTKEDKTIQLTPAKIKQEIFRPTLSSYLPIDNPKINLDSAETSWDVGFNHLTAFKKEFGHTNVAKRQEHQGYALGEWCVRQRTSFTQGNLSQLKQNKLQNIGFDFNPLETEWNRRYEQYKRYIQQTGSSYISKRTDFEGEHLGTWVETQRQWYKSGKMSQDRIDKLLAINPDLFNRE